MFCTIILMKIHFLYLLYTWNWPVFLLSLVLKNHPHVTCKSWEIKTNLTVSWEVTEGRSVNLCTQFFSSTKSWKRQYLNFNGHRITQYLSFNYPRNFLKHQFDALQEKVSISWAGESLLSLGLETVSWLKYCTPSPYWVGNRKDIWSQRFATFEFMKWQKVLISWTA